MVSVEITPLPEAAKRWWQFNENETYKNEKIISNFYLNIFK